MQMKASDLMFQHDHRPAQFQQFIKDNAYLAFLSIIGALFSAKQRFLAWQSRLSCATSLYLFAAVALQHRLPFLASPSKSHDDRHESQQGLMTILPYTETVNQTLSDSPTQASALTTAMLDSCQQWPAILQHNGPGYHGY